MELQVVVVSLERREYDATSSQECTAKPGFYLRAYHRSSTVTRRLRAFCFRKVGTLEWGFGAEAL